MTGTTDTAADRIRELEHFLKDVERRAFKIAQIALRNVDDALDVVQDAMLQLARRYATRPASEWRSLFYRILQNRIHDCQRHRRVRSRVIAWLPLGSGDDEEPLLGPAQAPVSDHPALIDQMHLSEMMQAFERVLSELPARQQQAFLLRNLECLDVATTAAVMGCSQGSVKTHYFRAVQTLRQRLEEFES